MDIKAALNDKSTLIVVLLGLALIVTSVVGYLIYYYTRPGANVKKYTTEFDQTLYPVNGKKASAFTMPKENEIKGKNMDQMSISFWVYFENVKDAGLAVTSTASTTPRHIFHFGSDAYSKMNPWNNGFYAQIGSDNKLQVYLGTNESNQYDGKNFGNVLSQQINYMVATRGLVFDYIPEKRWVFVVVTQNKASGTITGYLDGEKVVTKTPASRVLDPNQTSGAAVQTQLKKTCIGCPGKIDKLFIGMDTGSKGNGGFPGLLSMLRLHSWEMSLDEIRKFYRMGPIDNIWARMGLPAYTLRSPIYDRSNMVHDFGAVSDE